MSEAQRVIEVPEGDGYAVRAKLLQLDTVQIVVVDWMHPNYGYYSDGGVFTRFAHSADSVGGWRGLSSAAWMSEYESEDGAERFLQKYPQFKPLFEEAPPNPLSVVFGEAG